MSVQHTHAGHNTTAHTVTVSSQPRRHRRPWQCLLLLHVEKYAPAAMPTTQTQNTPPMIHQRPTVEDPPNAAGGEEAAPAGAPAGSSGLLAGSARSGAVNGSVGGSGGGSQYLSSHAYMHISCTS